VKRSNRLLILLGLIVAISGAVAAAVVANGSGGGGTGTPNGPAETAVPTPTPEPTVQVVVAKQDIHAGDTITASMLTLKPMTISERDALGGGTYGSVDQVVGTVAGSDIANGRAIVSTRDFVSSGGSAIQGKDLSPSVAQGMVGVSMEVDQTTGVGTLLVPGDHVDIILSTYVAQLAISGAKAGTTTTLTIPGTNEVTTKMVIRNRRVIATLLPPVQPATGAAANPSNPVEITPTPTIPIVQFDQHHMLVIVEVMPEEAEVINWAQRTEITTPRNYIDLSIALRSRADDEVKASHADTGGITYYQLIQNYGVLPPNPLAQIPAKLGLVIQW
jgi:Flp pilus assembly protein CpaB